MENSEIAIAKVADELLDQIDTLLEQVLSKERSSQQEKDLIQKIQQFQPCPQLIDKSLKKFVSSLLSAYQSNNMLDYLGSTEFSNTIGVIFYEITKLRGYKTVQHCLDSNFYLIDSLIIRLQNSREYGIGWQENCLLLLWLGVLILSPFPLTPEKNQSIFRLGSTFLNKVGKENEAASYLMANFVTRFKNSEVMSLFYESLPLRGTVNDKISFLRCNNLVLKKANHADILPYLDMQFDTFVTELAETEDVVLLKLLIKNIGKIGVIFESTYQVDKVEDIINILLNYIDSKETVIRYTVSRQFGKLSHKLPEEFRKDIVNCLIEELDINLLSTKLNLDIQVDGDVIDINKYHGVLLVFSELALESLIPCEYLQLLTSIICQTIFVVQQRLSYSIGNNVRDSSCFLSWSLIRKQMFHSREDCECLVVLFKQLMFSTCFDTDLMIRRASAAVIQELLGRYGDFVLATIAPRSEINKLKIKLIELLDYVKLGNLQRSFQLPIEIGDELEGFMRTDFIEFLKHLVIGWNYTVRCESSDILVKLLIKEGSPPDDIIDYLACMPTTDGSLMAISKLSSLLTNDKITELASRLKPALDTFEFDFHISPFHKGEEYLLILNSLQYDLTDTNWETTFNIIRQDSREEVYEAFKTLIINLRTEIPKKYTEKWKYYIENKNKITSKALGYCPSILSSNFEEFLSLVFNQKIDYEVRAGLIGSISYFLSNHDHDLHLERMIDLLEDYTITNQGDVGSYIRMAMMNLIENNLHKFKDFENSIDVQLFRLSVETMERLRWKSLELLLLIHPEWQGYLQKEPRTNATHFRNILEIYRHEILIPLIGAKNEQLSEISRSFWKGYAFSVGSSRSVGPEVKAALRPLVMMIIAHEFNDDEFSQIIVNIMSNLKLVANPTDKDRANKLYNCTLSLIVKLIDSNILTKIERDSLKTLFVRVYNLQLKAPIMRLGNCLAILKWIYQKAEECSDSKSIEMQHGIMKRLIDLSLKHKSSNVRQISIQVLFELYYWKHQKQGAYDGTLELLEKLDWNDNGLEKYVGRLPF
ncbi:Tubulin folding factor D [Komagataella phaffii CBS 7435]|uniref:Tubulin folding factor D n=2 Tax=Komagataella phaffii TaxID=460519 RepID=C4R473_KOMPG|nr:Tubulin folding factor D [Komagataella phaffii GS115]AOA64171.1 GQ67_03380T0 [Komagataella phaffii]CAH2449893.1 Tubulin folding factor D [Komagataella phaffii CBS 7435]AOA68739.1 GQ68_03349T0 [Komagataella phaffii GS115]CAY70359.1 Tubulin folding factor D [Komagataella phaffii GS115]CCA39847.1 Tubulin folding factor D [Komagataella phaffii CBS 7435]